MRNNSTKAHDQLMKWNNIRNEWNDKKLNEIETDYINPMQNLLILINEKIDEIYDFISITEDKLNNIKED